MKRCPKCNRTFDDDWLSFCTEDGTTLVESQSAQLPSEPPPTVWIPPAMDTNPAGDKPFDFPGSYNPPSGWQPPPPPAASVWQPPPPPIAYQPPTQQGFAIASLVVGLVSITVGWCYLALVSGPVAIGLGLAALSQIRKDPDRYGGKPMAIIGIVTGAVPFAVLFIVIVLAIIMSAVKS